MLMIASDNFHAQLHTRGVGHREDMVKVKEMLTEGNNRRNAKYVQGVSKLVERQ